MIQRLTDNPELFVDTTIYRGFAKSHASLAAARSAVVRRLLPADTRVGISPLEKYVRSPGPDIAWLYLRFPQPLSVAGIGSVSIIFFSNTLDLKRVLIHRSIVTERDLMTLVGGNILIL